jgi:hypothetical protein
VAEQLLDGADVSARLEQMRGEAMSKGMRGSRLGYSSSLGRRFDCSLQQALMHMVAAHDAGARVDRDVGGGEHVLPAPFAGGIGVFAFERVGEPDAAQAIGESWELFILIIEG